MKKIILYVCVATFLMACNSQTPTESKGNLDEVKKAIAASNAIYFTSFANNDSAIFINRYTEDACLMPGNSPKLCGSDAIAKFFRAKYNKGYRGGEFETVAVYGDAIEYVTEEAIGRIFDATGKQLSEGKILVLWKKTPNGWKMYRDSFSSNIEPK